jgi:hypothetical protein
MRQRTLDSMAYLSDVGKYGLVVALSSFCTGTAVGTSRVSELPLLIEELTLSFDSTDLNAFPSRVWSRFSSSYYQSSELNSQLNLLIQDQSTKSSNI